MKKNILIIILIIIVLCLIGYIVYEKNDIKIYNKNTTTTTIVKTEMTQSDQENLEKLIDKYYYVLWNKTSINDLSNREKQILGILKNANGGSIETAISSDQMKEALNSLFTNKQTINNENIKGLGLFFACDHDAWNYDASTSNYEYVHQTGHGMCTVGTLIKKVVDSSVKNNEYTIGLKYVMTKECDGPDYSKLYGNLNDLIDDKNEVITLTDDNAFDYDKAVSYVNSNYESIKSKLDTYTYVFTKNSNGDFTLTNYSRQKAS